MRRKYINFLKGVSANFVSRLGAALTTSAVIVFLIMEALRILGIITNAYLGLITYLIFPALFVFGLLLIPLGWRIYIMRSGKSSKEVLSERFPQDEVSGGFWGAGLVKTIGLLTIVNLLLLGIASQRTLHFMDTAEFCGTACHMVMNPEWTTYLQSPHARVKCVECHVGEGFEAMVDSKINGLRQIVSLLTGAYPRPIPTPVQNLRPARETCDKCHWPEKFGGNRLVTIPHYGMDEKSTPVYNTLNLKIGSGAAGIDRGSHWHIAEKNQVRYQPADDSRLEIRWVELRQEGGGFKRYTNNLYEESPAEADLPVRIMDCVDCHNRATHIYERPENAIDTRISRGILTAGLPYIKREGMAAITKGYPEAEHGERMIETYIRNFYRDNYPEIFAAGSASTDSALTVLKSIYRRNIHPYMNIGWGDYPSHLGHRDGRGCFRCHNSSVADEAGQSISMDCTMCHSILAYENERPFEYLYPTDRKAVESDLKQYLGEEFIRNY